MNSGTPFDPNTPSDDALDGLLRDALQPAALDREALERIRAETAREWRAATERARVRSVHIRRSWIAALAAAASIAGVIVVGVVKRPAGEPAVVGTLSRLHQGSIEARWALVRHRQLHVGDALRVGDTI